MISIRIPAETAALIDAWRTSPVANPDPTRKPRSRNEAADHLLRTALTHPEPAEVLHLRRSLQVAGGESTMPDGSTIPGMEGWNPYGGGEYWSCDGGYTMVLRDADAYNEILRHNATRDRLPPCPAPSAANP